MTASGAGPVFIVGLPRSGTKLLRALLSNHPMLFIPPYETECLPWLIRHTPAGGWQGDAGFARLWAAIRPLPFFDYLAGEGSPLTGEVWQAHCRRRDAAGVFEGLVRAVAALRGERGWSVWGDKSPSHIGHIDGIARCFPTARFIHMVRDVRDVAASAQSAWGKHPLRTAQRWRDAVLPVHAQAVRGDRWLLEVRFEDMVADPEATLRQVMAFIGLPFLPAQLDLPEAPENLGSARGLRQISAAACGQYRRRFSAARVAAIERVAIDAMRLYGYVPAQYHDAPRPLSGWRMRLLRGLDAVQLVRHRMQGMGLRQAIGFYARYSRFSGNRVQPARPVLMLGTGFATRGGIASVVSLYRDSGFLQRNRVDYRVTHGDGPAWKKLLLGLRALLWLCLHLPWRRYRLVHVHLSSRASFWRKYLLLVPVRLCRLPYVLHLHGSEFQTFHDQESGRLARRCIRGLFDHAAAIAVLSQGWQAWVQGMSANPCVVCIPNAVPLPMQPSQRLPGRLLFLGRLGERKGVYTLLDAVAALRPAFPDLRLVCAGDGEVDAVRARVQALGLQDCVTVPGWIDADARQRLLMQAAVLVLPSHNEGLPMAVLEAMAAGVAVVASPVGGIPEAITDGETGCLVVPGDAAALAAVLRRLLADAALLARLGDAARRRIGSEFSPQASEARLQALWQQVAP